MATTIDHTLEWRVWDDVFSGKVEVTRNEQTLTTDISVIMRGPWTRKLDQFNVGNMDGQIVQFTIPDILLNPDQGPDDQILLRDDVVIDDDGKRWTIVYSEQSVVDTHWYVAAVPERVAG